MSPVQDHSPIIRLAALVSLITVTGCSEIKADDEAPASARPGLSCNIPANLPRPKVERQPVQGTTTPQIARYTLALSWSPQFCRSRENDPRHATQCAAEQDFGFVLHGLWPEGGGKDQLAWCAPAEILPADVVRTNFCASPSPQLLQHEWAKHGTCMTRDPKLYFQKARTLYENVQTPDMDGLSRSGASVNELVAAVAKLNPDIPEQAIIIDTSKGDWLTEIKICYDAALQPAACPKGNRRREGARLKIWRSER
jgi:ribonuclease T2